MALGRSRRLGWHRTASGTGPDSGRPSGPSVSCHAWPSVVNAIAAVSADVSIQIVRGTPGESGTGKQAHERGPTLPAEKGHRRWYTMVATVGLRLSTTSVVSP